MNGANTNRRQRKKMILFIVMESLNSPNGSWESMTKRAIKTKEDTNFLTAILKKSIDAPCFPRRAGPGVYKYYDIENAAAHLHGTIDARQPAHAKH
jgi:hypothetical protein